MFKVGMKVVCINDMGFLPDHPKEGDICTIRDFYCDEWIGLVGTKPTLYFLANRFRPLTFGEQVAEEIEFIEVPEIEYQEALNQI